MNTINSVAYGYSHMEWKYENIHGNDPTKFIIVVSYVEGKSGKKEEEEMEGGSFNYVCYV
jgi:hypothetical protein